MPWLTHRFVGGQGGSRVDQDNVAPLGRVDRSIRNNSRLVEAVVVAVVIVVSVTVIVAGELRRRV